MRIRKPKKVESDKSSLTFDDSLRASNFQLHHRRSTDIAHQIERIKPKRTIPFAVLFTLLTLGVMAVGGMVYYFYQNYTSSEFHINTLKASDEAKVKYEVLGYMQRPFFEIDSNELSSLLKSSNPLIKDVHVNKSILGGLIINIDEFEPLCILKMGDVQYFYISEKELIPYTEHSANFSVINFAGTMNDMPYMDEYIKKTLKFKNDYSADQTTDSYTFDNFGNLTILSNDNKVIKADLKERYLSIDEQIKVIQNVLSNGNIKEVNVRFNYTIFK